MISAELNLEAFFGVAYGYGHDACVQHEDVQAWRQRLEFLGGGLDGGEGREVEFEVGYLGLGVESVDV